jgi:hypothetical protein
LEINDFEDLPIGDEYNAIVEYEEYLDNVWADFLVDVDVKEKEGDKFKSMLDLRFIDTPAPKYSTKQQKEAGLSQ